MLLSNRRSPLGWHMLQHMSNPLLLSNRSPGRSPLWRLKATALLQILSHVLQSPLMSHTFTIRLTDELVDWLKETSRRTGIPVGRLIREQLETAKAKAGKQPFLRHAGAITGGPPDVSSRKGFSRS